MKKKLFTCSICKKKIVDQYGNNAEPVNKGTCCDDCNVVVIIARIHSWKMKEA